jgi:hypothetical protein
MITKTLVLKILVAITLILIGILIQLSVDYHNRIQRERAEAAMRLAAEKAVAVELQPGDGYATGGAGVGQTQRGIWDARSIRWPQERG